MKICYKRQGTKKCPVKTNSNKNLLAILLANLLAIDFWTFSLFEFFNNRPSPIKRSVQTSPHPKSPKYHPGHLIGHLRHYLMAVVELFKYQLRETLECYVENFNLNLNSNLNLNNTVTKNSKNYIPNYIINQNVIFLVNP